MKPSEIINLARRQTGCTEDIVTKQEAYNFLNFVIEDFGADIRATDSWFWFEVLNLDITANNPSYIYDNDAWDYTWKFAISKIQSVWLKDTKIWKRRDLPVHFVDKINPNDFECNWEPRVCFITQHELNLIPKPKESTKLQVRGFNYNYELWYNSETSAWDDDEDDICIPSRWHYIIVEWMKYWMYGNMWSNFEAQRTASRQFYDLEKNKAIQNIVDRWQLADTSYNPEDNCDPMEQPNLNYLIY